MGVNSGFWRIPVQSDDGPADVERYLTTRALLLTGIWYLAIMSWKSMSADSVFSLANWFLVIPLVVEVVST